MLPKSIVSSEDVCAGSLSEIRGAGSPIGSLSSINSNWWSARSESCGLRRFKTAGGTDMAGVSKKHAFATSAAHYFMVGATYTKTPTTVILMVAPNNKLPQIER